MQDKKTQTWFLITILVIFLLSGSILLFSPVSGAAVGEPTENAQTFLSIVLRGAASTASATQTPTSTTAPTGTATPTNTTSPSATPTASATSTGTVAPSQTPTPSPTGSTTPSPSPTGSVSPSPSPTGSVSPSPTPSPSPTGSVSPSPTPSPSPTGSVSPSPTPTSSATPSPSPTGTVSLGDLVIGQPVLISTPPIIAYEPLEFQVVITNSGTSDINYPFYVDIWLNPTPTSRHANYVLIPSLPGGVTQTLVITAPFGYEYNSGNMAYFGEVDMGNLVFETNDFNNLSDVSATVPIATAVATPTYEPTPNGAFEVDATAWAFRQGWVSQPRTFVRLIDSSSAIVTSALTDYNGYFHFNGVFSGSYTLIACVLINGQQFASITSITVPYSPQNIYMTPGGCP